METRVTSEPVRIANAVKGLLVAVAPVLTLTGVIEITDEVLAAITVAVVAVGEFVATVWTRHRVSPVLTAPNAARGENTSDPHRGEVGAVSIGMVLAIVAGVLAVVALIQAPASWVLPVAVLVLAITHLIGHVDVG